MKETLILRKGLYANLNSESCPITPGAISITTDEPGIYLDLAEYDAQGNMKEGSQSRVRIGDFITFDSLEALYSETTKTYPVGSTPVYSEHALYYAKTENVLCKYDKESNSFIWINDLTPVYGTIDTLTAERIVPIEDAISTIKNTLATINSTIGERGDKHKATHIVDNKGNVTDTKTVFESIENEYDRAIAAEASLAQEIASIKGGDDVSLSKLKQDLTAEANARRQEDTNLFNSIMKVHRELINDNHNLKDYLENYINDNLAAADAMTFKGGVGFKTGTDVLDLPTTGVKKGDTFVITSDGVANVSHTYHAGDLMIANEDQPFTLQLKDEYIGQESQDTVLSVSTYNIAAGKTIYVYYVEMIDWQTQYDLSPDQEKSRDYSIAGCGYDIDRFGDTTPVLYPSALHPHDLPRWLMDYETQYFYVGTDKINNITYDKWRCVEDGRWNDGLKYIYTDVVVEAVHDIPYPYDGWTHVATGYNEAHEVKLDIDQSSNKLKLTSHVGDDLGSAEFISTSANLEITKATQTTGGMEKTIGFNFNLVWKTF